MKKQAVSKKTSRVLSRRALLAAAFIEGAAVVSVELLGAKMLIPLYGNSLVVWTSVMAVTIAALALGYFAGAKFSARKEMEKTLALVLAIAATCVALMPSLAGFLFAWLNASVYWGTVFSAVLLLGPSLFFLGTTSPLLIQRLAEIDHEKDQNTAGLSAGLVYAISTVGGILFTFIVGFLALPYAGVSLPVLCVAGFILAFAFYVHYEKKYLVIVACFILFTFKLLGDIGQRDLPGTKTLYESEGLLGQLKVVDIFDEKYRVPFRYLFINGVPQTVITNEDSPMRGTSGWPYSHKISILSTLERGIKRDSQEVLLLGIGGGSVARELSIKKMKLDLVDLDERMFTVARKYFYLEGANAHFTCDDARHFVRTSKKQYDLIVMDVFNAEVQPSYMFTQESFAELKSILSNEGMMIFNFGELARHEGLSSYRSVCNTLLAEGFHVYCNINEAEGINDVLIISSGRPLDLKALQRNQMDTCCTSQLWANDFIKDPATAITGKFADGTILTDDKPLLEVLNMETIKMWREWAVRNYALPEIKQSKKLFK